MSPAARKQKLSEGRVFYAERFSKLWLLVNGLGWVVRWEKECPNQHCICWPLEERKDLTEQQELDFAFLLLLRLLLRNTSVEGFWLAYTVNSLESELISCALVYFLQRWDKKFCSQRCVSPAHRICHGGFLRLCASGKKLGYPSWEAEMSMKVLLAELKIPVTCLKHWLDNWFWFFCSDYDPRLDSNNKGNQMMQSPGWKKGFGHNQQGTASPVEVSLPAFQSTPLSCSPECFPGHLEGVQVRLQISVSTWWNNMCTLMNFAGWEGLQVCWL